MKHEFHEKFDELKKLYPDLMRLKIISEYERMQLELKSDVDPEVAAVKADWEDTGHNLISTIKRCRERSGRVLREARFFVESVVGVKYRRT